MKTTIINVINYTACNINNFSFHSLANIDEENMKIIIYSHKIRLIVATISYKKI